MEEIKTNITRNTFWFTTALVIEKIIAFIYFTYLARFLGAENFGFYIFSLSYITIFAVIIDIGTNHYITREIAKDNSKAQKITSNIFGFKLITSLIAVIFAGLIANLINYDPQLIKLIYFACTVMVVESFVLSIYSVIRGFHNLKYESWATVVVHFCILIVGLIVVNISQNIIWLLLILSLSHTLNLIAGLYILKYKFSIKLKLQFDFNYWKKIALVVLPFALTAIFSKVYGAFDQTLLAKLADPEQLGFYGVAYKLTFSLQFLPMALMATLYPAMSKYYKENKDNLNQLFPRAIKYLLLITLPIIAGILVYGTPLIKTLYTKEYLPAVLPLQILIVGLPLLFLNFPIGSLLNASNRQKRQTINIGIAMIVNIILNLILIPKYQSAGAALASLISTIVFFVLGWEAILKILKLNYRNLLIFLSKLILVTLAIYQFGYWTSLSLNWIFSAIITIILYLFLIIALRLFTKHEFKIIIKSFK